MRLGIFYKILHKRFKIFLYTHKVCRNGVCLSSSPGTHSPLCPKSLVGNLGISFSMFALKCTFKNEYLTL